MLTRTQPFKQLPLLGKHVLLKVVNAPKDFLHVISLRVRDLFELHASERSFFTLRSCASRFQYRKAVHTEQGYGSPWSTATRLLARRPSWDDEGRMPEISRIGRRHAMYRVPETTNAPARPKLHR